MTLSDFINFIPVSILESGYKYYINNHVISLEVEEPDFWEAEVAGSENYEVTIVLNNNEIEEYFCDCPFDGEICKHVTAVIYKLAELKQSPQRKKKSGQTKKSKKKQIESIFEKATKNELKEFIEYIFANNSKIKNNFIAFFTEFLDEGIDHKYKNLVKVIIKHHEDRYGFIAYRESFPLARELSNLLVKAETNLENNLVESLTICKAIIEEMPLLANHTDDSSGYLMDLSNTAFDIFSMITEKSPPQLKDELFDYCIKEITEEKYHDLDFGDGFFSILPKLITLEEQEKKYLQLLDELIENDNNRKFSYRTTWLLKEKIIFFNKKNRYKEARKIIEENINISDFREMLFNEEISKKNYDKAIELGLEGIEIAKVNSFSGHIKQWKENLLAVFKIKNDIDNIRKYAKELFLDHHYDMTYYKILKKTYQKKEWEIISESIIKKIKGKDAVGDYGHAYTLANIFIEENYKSRLLKLLEINSTRIKFIDDFSKKLLKEYPKEITNFYADGIKKIAINTGRDNYEKIAYYLKKLRPIEGGEKKVILLIKYFKDIYKNRPAMMEILNKNFKNIS